MALRVALVLILAFLIARPALAGCDEEVRRADALKTRAVEGMDRTEKVLGELADAARDASECLAETDRVEAARWYSYEIWALYSLRWSAEGLSRITDFRRTVAGVDAATDAVVYTYEGGFLTRLSRLEEAMAAYGRALEQAAASGNPYRLTLAHISMSELARRMERTRDVFRHLHLADSVMALHDFRERSLMRSRVAVHRADAVLYYSDMLDTLSVDAVAEAHVRLEEAQQWAGENGQVALRDQTALTAFELERLFGARADLSGRALAYYNTHVRGRGDRQEMTWLNEVAMILLDDGQSARATRFLRRSYAIAEALYELEYQARVANRLGRVMEAAGAYDEAADWYRTADGVFARHMREGGGTELLAGAFSRTTEPLRELALLQLRQGDVRGAFRTIERARAQFLSRLRQQAAFASEADRRHADSLITAIRDVRSALAHSTGRAERSRLELAETQLLIDLTAAFPEMTDIEELDIAAVQAKLADRDQVLLSYLVLSDAPWIGRPSHAYVFVITPDTVAAVPLETDAAGLAARVRRALPMSQGAGSPVLADASLADLKELYDILIAPVSPLIADGQRLVVTPDGPLFHLPFGTLVKTYDGRFNYADARYLIHDHAVSIELSAALYLDPGGSSRRGGVVALSRSDFGVVEGMNLALVDLPAVRGEATSIRRAVQSTRVLDGEAATPDAFFSALGHAAVVHVATHATVDAASMLNHAIVLHPDSSRASGVVYAFDLLRRRFDTPLVVLSACATAAGPIIGGEGPAGFQYGFRASGVGSVVATQWLVEDAAMAQVSSSFYRYLTRGLPKDEALRRAQLEVLDSSPAHANPKFWAAAVVHGDAAPLPLRANRLPLATGVLILGSAVLLVAFLRRRRRLEPEHIEHT